MVAATCRWSLLRFSEGHWQYQSEMPRSRMYFGGGYGPDGRLYIVGGFVVRYAPGDRPLLSARQRITLPRSLTRRSECMCIAAVEPLTAELAVCGCATAMGETTAWQEEKETRPLRTMDCWDGSSKRW